MNRPTAFFVFVIVSGAVCVADGCQAHAPQSSDSSHEHLTEQQGPLADRLADASGDASLPGSPTLLGEYTGHGEFELAAWDVSSDGTTMVAVDTHHRLHVWDLETGRLEHRFKLQYGPDGDKVPHDPPFRARLGPDGRHVFVEFRPDRNPPGASRFGAWAVDDPASGWPELGEHAYEAARFKYVDSVAFHPTKDRLFTTGSDGTLRIWKLADGGEISSKASAVGRMTVSPDGSRLWTTGGSRTVTRSTPNGPGWGFASTNIPPATIEWQTDKSRKLSWVDVEDCATLRVAHDGQKAAYRCSRGRKAELVVRHPKKGEKGAELFSAPLNDSSRDHYERRVRFSADSSQLSVYSGHGVDVYELPSGNHVSSFEPPRERLESNPDCKLAETLFDASHERMVARYRPADSSATGQCRGRFRVWQTDGSDSPLKIDVDDGPPPIDDLVFDPRPNRASPRLASIHPDETIRIWNPETGQKAGHLKLSRFLEDRTLRTVDFVADNRVLAAATSSDENRVHVGVWNLESNEQTTYWSWGRPDNELGVSQIVVSPNGRRLGVVYSDRLVVIHDARSGEHLTSETLEDLKTRVAPRFNRDGRYLLAPLSAEPYFLRMNVDTGKLDRLDVRIPGRAINMSTDLKWVVAENDDKLHTLYRVEEPDLLPYPLDRYYEVDNDIPVFSEHRLHAIDHDNQESRYPDWSIAGTAVDLRDPKSGSKRWELSLQFVRTSAFSPDGSVIAFGLGDGSVALYSLDRLMAD